MSAVTALIRTIRNTMKTKKGKKVTKVSNDKFDKVTKSLLKKEKKFLDKHQRIDVDNFGKRSISGKVKNEADDLASFGNQRGKVEEATHSGENADQVLRRRRKQLKKNPDHFRK
jgi:hypothetical protein